MWQICQNLLTKKVEVWLLFGNLPTCTHPSVAQAGPSWFCSDPVHWYNNNLTSYTHLLPNPTSANNLHSHKLQLPRHPPLNQTWVQIWQQFINLIYITIALNPTTTRHQPRNPKTAKAENRSTLFVLCFVLFFFFFPIATEHCVTVNLNWQFMTVKLVFLFTVMIFKHLNLKMFTVIMTVHDRVKKSHLSLPFCKNCVLGFYGGL